MPPLALLFSRSLYKGVGLVVGSVLYMGHSLDGVKVRGANLQNLWVYTYNSVIYGAVGRHCWQSFGFAGGIVRALASVLLGSATLSGYTYVTLRVSPITLSVS